VPGSEGLRMAEAEGIGFRRACRGAISFCVVSGGVARGLAQTTGYNPSSLRDE